MSKNAKLWLVVPVIAGGAALVAFWPHSEKVSTRASSTATPAVATQVSPALGELQLLRARVTGLEAEVRAVQSMAQPVALAPAAVEPSAEAPASAPPPAMVQAHYDTVFAAESLDTRWASSEESTVLAFFAQDSVKGAHLEKVECRESMCRIRVHFDDSNARSQFLTNMGSPPFDHGGFFRTDEATGAFTLYTAREGRSLPSVQPDPT